MNEEAKRIITDMIATTPDLTDKQVECLEKAKALISQA